AVDPPRDAPQRVAAADDDGHGIRYSTIYLANQDQIRDPNRIWPGQVFTLPSETPEGEQADLDAIGEQAVRPEEREAVQE
ncbi:MAG: LysM peptidoglycan-binding domain-containing protein, partial [Aquamicrobium sp.]|nr:LysM peptidoglycan-binding domain-containing protein [Aquamicrobium sp.]